MEKRIVLSRKQFIDQDSNSRIDRVREKSNYHMRYIDKITLLFVCFILGILLLGLLYYYDLF